MFNNSSKPHASAARAYCDKPSGAELNRGQKESLAKIQRQGLTSETVFEIFTKVESVSAAMNDDIIGSPQNDREPYILMGFWLRICKFLGVGTRWLSEPLSLSSSDGSGLS